MSKVEQIHEVVELVPTVYKQWRDCPGLERFGLEKQLRALQNVLEDIEDNITTNPLPTHIEEAALLKLVRSNKFNLKTLQNLGRMYGPLSQPEKDVWSSTDSNEYQFVMDAKTQLEFTLSDTEQLYESIQRSDENQIGRVFNHLLQLSNQPLSSNAQDFKNCVEFDDPGSWKKITNMLLSNGINSRIIDNNVDYIKNWLHQADTMNRLPDISSKLDPPQETFQKLSISNEAVSFFPKPAPLVLISGEDQSPVELTNLNGPKHFSPPPSLYSNPISSTPNPNDQPLDTSHHKNESDQIHKERIHKERRLLVKDDEQSQVASSSHLTLSTNFLDPFHANNSEVSMIKTQDTKVTNKDRENPPSPIEDSNILLTHNGHQILTAWYTHDWEAVIPLLEIQITYVRDHTFADDFSNSAQSLIQFLMHLQGVAYSFHGKWMRSQMAFERVILENNTTASNDLIVASAAHWLAETSLMRNQKIDAMIAYAIFIVHSELYYVGQKKDMPKNVWKIAEDMIYLNSVAGTSWKFRKSLQNNNVDLCNILAQKSSEWKLSQLTKAEEIYNKMPTRPLRDDPHSQSNNVHLTLTLDIDCLTHASLTSIPFAADPTFQARETMHFLQHLTVPVSPLRPTDIKSVFKSSLSSAATFYRTKRNADWFIDAVRQALRTLRIEHRVFSAASLLLRIPLVHSGVAYTMCFTLALVKLAVRAGYVLRLSEAQYTTRLFGTRGIGPRASLMINMGTQTAPEKVRTDLMASIKAAMEDVERQQLVDGSNDGARLDGGGDGDFGDFGDFGDVWDSSAEIVKEPGMTVFELSGAERPPKELMGSTEYAAELEGRQI